MRILALDLGDVWVGTALSDGLQMFARPYETTKNDELISFLKALFQEYKIGTVVVGLPTTLKGTNSQQTDKIIAQKETLEKEFTLLNWVLWDERNTSKQAAQIHKKKNDKHHAHSIAAALILETYLMHLQFKKNLEQE